MTPTLAAANFLWVVLAISVTLTLVLLLRKRRFLRSIR